MRTGIGGTHVIILVTDAGTDTQTGRAMVADPTDGQITGNGITATAIATPATMMMGLPMPANHVPINAIPAAHGPVTVGAVMVTIEERHLAAPVSRSTMIMAHLTANLATILAILAPRGRVVTPVMPITDDYSSLEAHTVGVLQDITILATSIALPAIQLVLVATELPQTTVKLATQQR